MRGPFIAVPTCQCHQGGRHKLTLRRASGLKRLAAPRPGCGSNVSATGKWITHRRDAQNGHILGAGQVLVGHHVCLGHGGSHDHLDVPGLRRRCTGRRSTPTARNWRGRRPCGIFYKSRFERSAAVGCWVLRVGVREETLLGQRVAFATDPTQRMYDRYGRTLAYLDKADGWGCFESKPLGRSSPLVRLPQPSSCPR